MCHFGIKDWANTATKKSINFHPRHKTIKQTNETKARPTKHTHKK